MKTNLQLDWTVSLKNRFIWEIELKTSITKLTEISKKNPIFWKMSNVNFFERLHSPSLYLEEM